MAADFVRRSGVSGPVAIAAALLIVAGCAPQTISSRDINLDNLGFLAVSIDRTSGSASGNALAAVVETTDIGAGRDPFESADHILLDMGEQILVQSTALTRVAASYQATVPAVAPPAAYEIGFKTAAGTTDTALIVPPSDFAVSLKDAVASIANGLTVSWTNSAGASSGVAVNVTITRSGNILLVRLNAGDSGELRVSAADLVPDNPQVPALAPGQSIVITVERVSTVSETLDGLAGGRFWAKVSSQLTATLAQ